MVGDVPSATPRPLVPRRSLMPDPYLSSEFMASPFVLSARVHLEAVEGTATARTRNLQVTDALVWVLCLGLALVCFLWSCPEDYCRAT